MVVASYFTPTDTWEELLRKELSSCWLAVPWVSPVDTWGGLVPFLIHWQKIKPDYQPHPKASSLHLPGILLQAGGRLLPLSVSVSKCSLFLRISELGNAQTTWGPIAKGDDHRLSTAQCKQIYRNLVGISDIFFLPCGLLAWERPLNHLSFWFGVVQFIFFSWLLPCLVPGRHRRSHWSDLLPPSTVLLARVTFGAVFLSHE